MPFSIYRLIAWISSTFYYYFLITFYPLIVLKPSCCKICRFCCSIVCQWGILSYFSHGWWKSVLVMVNLSKENIFHCICVHFRSMGLENLILFLQQVIVLVELDALTTLVDKIWWIGTYCFFFFFTFLLCTTHASINVSGVHFKKALFVPNTSVYYKVGTSPLSTTDTLVDLSWQLTLQRIWENLVQGEKGIYFSKYWLIFEIHFAPQLALKIFFSVFFPSCLKKLEYQICSKIETLFDYRYLLLGSLMGKSLYVSL